MHSQKLFATRLFTIATAEDAYATIPKLLPTNTPPSTTMFATVSRKTPSYVTSPPATETLRITAWASVFAIEIPVAKLASISQPSITYGSVGVPLPPVTPLAGVNPASPTMRIGARGTYAEAAPGIPTSAASETAASAPARRSARAPAPPPRTPGTLSRDVMRVYLVFVSKYGVMEGSAHVFRLFLSAVPYPFNPRSERSAAPEPLSSSTAHGGRWRPLQPRCLPGERSPRA